MRHAIWSKIADKLTLSQFEKCMFLTYKEKALKVKQVSQSKKLHVLADSLYEASVLVENETVNNKAFQNGIKATVTTYETKTEVASKLNSLFGVSK